MSENDSMENIELKTDREVLISLYKDVQYIRGNIESLQTVQEVTNTRIDKLEKGHAWMIAVAGAVAFVVSVFKDI
ncbi:MAG: hypothetical protein Q8O19_05750, partial [Rectinemataceae bacterium]|nr:hypothetical protein [Rectinemataceae bacterium]